MSKRKSRPDLVGRLQKMWADYYTKTPYLKSVDIGDGKPLRGVSKSQLDFEFPITVLCGPNGTGKTTFMALSVLAFHDDEALTLSHWPRGYYDFSYFFGFSEKEKHEKGILIGWKYTDGSEDRFEKGQQRWIRYKKNGGKPRRPTRGAEFVGLSRIIPAFERKGYNRALSNARRHKPSANKQDLAQYLATVLARPYKQIISYRAKTSSGSYIRNDYNHTHTSFNAGAGEECLTYILDTLLSAKEGSFIAIEEIEIGLHPSVMDRLVDVILEIACNRKLQILITTHSPDFLRCCPKESLIQAERAESIITFTHMPHVENAIRCLSGKSSVNLYVLCEDEESASLIELCVPKKFRHIVHIKGYGSKSELISKAKAVQMATDQKVLIIWDGDTESKYLENLPEGLSGCKL